MKLTTYLTLTATGIAAWLLYKNLPARTKRQVKKSVKSAKTKILHHKRNGMKTHAAN